MAVSTADLAELARLGQAMPEHGGTDLSALQSAAEVIAYVATVTRADGGYPPDACELLVRHAQLPPAEVRRVARLLRVLGYVEVSQRLAEVAGRRKHGLRPLAQ
jgi:hypothetical protein